MGNLSSGRAASLRAYVGDWPGTIAAMVVRSLRSPGAPGCLSPFGTQNQDYAVVDVTTQLGSLNNLCG
jgi:hypothetical protein